MVIIQPLKIVSLFLITIIILKLYLVALVIIKMVCAITKYYILFASGKKPNLFYLVDRISFIMD